MQIMAMYAVCSEYVHSFVIEHAPHIAAMHHHTQLMDICVCDCTVSN